MKRIILASRSPRREALLRQAGLEFSIIVSGAKEDGAENTPPEEYVKAMSLRKAQSVADKISDAAVIIGADTIVVRKGRIMGKPRDREQAFKMLKELQDAMHSVLTGVTLIDLNPGREAYSTSFAEKTAVFMRPLTDDEIYSYIATGEPMDKAGAYAIQDRGSLLVEKIEGDFYNVVGLPIMKTYL